MHGFGGAELPADDEVAGAGAGVEDEGAVLRDVAVRVLHGVEHWRQRRGERYGDLGGVGGADAEAGGGDGGGAGVFGGAVDGVARDEHDAEGDSVGQCVQWEAYSALRWLALFSGCCWYLVAGKGSTKKQKQNLLSLS